jgi:triacylglycerol lipase
MDRAAVTQEVAVSTTDDMPAGQQETEEATLAERGEAVVQRAKWRGAHVREVRWQLEAARLMADPVWRGVDVPRGDGSPVLLIPGFLAGDQSLSLMGRWLRRIGYLPRRAGIYFNVRCSDVAVDRLEHTLHHVHMRTGQKVAIVGHSRGGHFAKALASRCPDQISQVISMGSGLDDPFDISETTLRAVTRVRDNIHRRDPERAAKGCFTTSCTCRFTSDFRAPFPEQVPLTSIYTKGDGVVRWQACVVPYARCVEVRGSHIGLAFNRHAYRVIGQTLADGPTGGTP